MNKSELRKYFLARRKTLSEAEIQQMSRAICDRFFASTDLSFIKTIHCYLPIVEKKEPDTWLIIDRLRREYPHIRIVVPRVEDNGEMESLFFEGLHQLERSKLNILEPRQGVPAGPEKIDLILVPLLAYDTTGHRVGYGKGFYDRHLKKCRPDCIKTGLSFFEPAENIADASALDVRLNRCITPDRIFAF